MDKVLTEFLESVDQQLKDPVRSREQLHALATSLFFLLKSKIKRLARLESQLSLCPRCNMPKEPRRAMCWECWEKEYFR